MLAPLMRCKSARQACSAALSRCTQIDVAANTKTVVVVLIVAVIVVAIARASILGIIVPRTAAQRTELP